jgi:hypothetical protein
VSTVASLWVKVNGDVSGLTKSLAVANAALAGFGTKSNSSAVKASSAFRVAQVAAVGLGIVAAKGLEAALHATEEWAAQTRQLELTTGLAAEQASALLFAGQSLGVGTDQLSRGFGLLDKNIINNTTNFAKYGIATRDAQGQQLGFIPILKNVADQYTALGGGIAGAALVQNVFGRSGRSLLPILARGSAGLQQLLDQAKAYGAVIGDDTVAAAKRLAVAQRQLGLSLHGVAIQVGVEVLPVASAFIFALTKLVGVLHLIPGPVVAIGAGFLVLTGLVAGAQLVFGFFTQTWGKLVGAFTASGAASGAAAGEIGSQVASVTALAASVDALLPSLQALAGVEGEVALSASAAAKAIGFQASQSGLLVPESAALGAANKSIISTTGGLGGLSAAASTAALGVGAIAVALGFAAIQARDARAAVARFNASVSSKLTQLTQGGPGAAIVRAQAATPLPTRALPGSIALGGGLFNQAQATKAARAAMAQLAAVQALAAKSSTALSASIAKTVAELGDLGAAASLPTDFFDQAVTAVSKIQGGLDQFTKVSGIDSSSIVSDFSSASASIQKDLDSGKISAVEATAALHAAASQALTSARGLYKQWHDQIVQTFGGAGSALDQFANKSNVDLAKATQNIDQYTGQIHSFGSDIRTITDEFGKRSKDFVQFATSQGLAQAGLTHAIAGASKKDAAAFIDSWNRAQGATSSLASQIQKALDPMFNRIILQLKNVARAFLGLPPITAKDHASPVIARIQRELAALHSKAISVDVTYIPHSRDRPPVVPHGGGLIRHEGGPIGHAQSVARMHSGGLKPDEVPAVLQRGEYVIRRQAVAKIGMPVLDSLNRLHSGGDIGDMLSKIPTAISKVSNPAPSSTAAGASRTIERFHTGGTTERTREVSRTIERFHTGGNAERTFRSIEKLHTGGMARMDLEVRGPRGVPQVLHLGGAASVPAIAMSMSQVAPVFHAGGVVLHSGGLLRQFVVLHSGGTRTAPAIHVHVPSLSVAQHQHRVLRFHSGGRMREVRVIERMPIFHAGGMTPQLARLIPLLVAGSLSVFHHGGLRGLARQVLHDGGYAVPTEAGVRVRGLSQAASQGDVNLKVSLDRRRFGRDLEWAQADFGP